MGRSRILYVYTDAYHQGRTAVFEIDYGIGKIKVEFPCISSESAKNLASRMIRNEGLLDNKFLKAIFTYLERRLIYGGRR